MRNEVLRDVLAGCAGVLAVAAAIGLPRASAPVQQPAAPAPQYMLLPYFQPNYCRANHAVPSAPPQSQRIRVCR
jgi:ribonuclease I